MNFVLQNIINILQVIAVGAILWLFYKRFIKNTNSEKNGYGSCWLGCNLAVQLAVHVGRIASNR